MSPALKTTALLTLSALPILAGAARLSEMSFGAPIMDPTMGSTHMPAPMAWHIVTASVFLILGAVQFLPITRRRAWHRLAGRVAVIAGLIGAATGLWMTLALPPEPSNGPLMVGMRAFFSVLWLVAMILGVAYAIRRRIPQHRAWIIRGYAVAAATGLQSLILIPWFLMFGVPSGLPSDLVMLAGWLAALIFGEAAIRRHAPQRT